MDTIDITSIFPGWKIVRVLGKGSYGTVYEIERTKYGKNEKAAIKVIRIPADPSLIETLRSDGYDDNSIKSRLKMDLDSFVDEYDNMRKLVHTNIVNCDDIEYQQVDDGFGYTVYIKMELLTPLVSAIRGESNTEELAVKLATDICEALKHCENRSVVHRDIKPQNLFVNDYGEYKLGDFGIAREMDHATNATRTGTYKYMAPEVYNAQSYGNNVDIYSLGLVLYWILNERRLPFLPMPPEIPNAQQEGEANARRFRGDTVPSPKNGNQRLKEIVLKACEADKTKRYQTAAEMLADLQKLSLTAAETDSSIGDEIYYDEGTMGNQRDDGTLGNQWDDRTMGNQWDDIDEPTGYSMNVSEEKELSQNSNVVQDDDRTLGNQWNDEGTVPIKNSDNDSKSSSDNFKTSTTEETVYKPPIINSTKSIDIKSLFNDDDPLPEPVVKKSKKGWIIAAAAIILVIAAIAMIILAFSSEFEYVVIDNGSARITGYFGSKANVDIPDTIGGHRVIEIGRGAFESCSSLTSVTIPDSVTTIGDSAFYNCSSLTSVNIPDSVTTIGDSAFYNCSSLTSVNIPDSVTIIGNSVFSGCSRLTSVNIPDSVTTIDYYAFYHCRSLTSVTIPDSVTTIGDSAFFGCSRLTSVTIPNSVTTIGNSAFSSCSSLTSVTIPDSVTTIGNSAFSSCSRLTSVTIPDSVTTIGGSAFFYCGSLTSVNIPDSVTTIEYWAFYNCRRLTSVTIPDSVTDIGVNVFYGCDNLTISGNAGSAAESYAKENNIPFSEI